MSPLLALLAAQVPDLVSGAVLPLALAGVIALARWAVAAARREGATDVQTARVEKTVERTAEATQRHDVVDATTAQAVAGFASTLTKMDGKIDQIATAIADQKVAHAEVRTAADGDRQRITRVEADLVALNAKVDSGHATLNAKIDGVDQRQSDARHVLRGETHGLTPIVDLAKSIAAQSEAQTKSASAMLEAVRLLTEREAARAPRPGRRG